MELKKQKTQSVENTMTVNCENFGLHPSTISNDIPKKHFLAFFEMSQTCLSFMNVS